jgi:hypothetical protein
MWNICSAYFTTGFINPLEIEMKQLFKIGLLALALTFSSNLAAQENIQPNENLSRFYDTELFQWSYGMFSGMTLNYQNTNSNTMFGINESMKAALTRYEDTNRLYRSYRGKTIAGNVLIWGGLAAVIGGAFVPAFGGAQNLDNYDKIGLGVMTGGLVSEIIGSFVLSSGQENIFDAVNLYNRQKIKEYK